MADRGAKRVTFAAGGRLFALKFPADAPFSAFMEELEVRRLLLGGGAAFLRGALQVLVAGWLAAVVCACEMQSAPTHSSPVSQAHGSRPASTLNRPDPIQSKRTPIQSKPTAVQGVQQHLRL